MLTGEGRGMCLRDVDIMIGGIILNDDAWLQKGEGGVKNLGKSNYVIYGRSLCKSQ